MGIGYTRDEKGKRTKNTLMEYVNTLHQSVGHGGNTDILIAEMPITNMNDTEITNPCILSAQRTEEGKRLRRLHGDKNASFEHREFSPRKDGISNTITTIQKDNLLIEPFNTDADGNAKTLLAGYYKFGGATLTREKGSSGTGVVEYDEVIVQRPHGANMVGVFSDCNF